MTAQGAGTRELGNWYYAVACTLILFGVLALTSIGLPFLVLGVAMFAMVPLVRRRSPAVVPLLSGIVLFFVTFVAISPVTCSISVSRSVREGQVEPTTEVSPTCVTALGTPAGSPGTGVLISLGVAVSIGSALYLILRGRR